ncbi:MAG: hypothetical protein R6U64_03905, partial [Bacteroidales bacterium]
APLVAMLFPAMTYGEDIIVEGSVSENLLFNINNDIQTIYSIFLPHLKRIRIHADQVYNHSHQTDNVASGFSGGIDSFYTLSQHFYSREVSPGFRITHLLYNNVGSHGQAGEALWRKRYHRLKRLPDKYGIPFIGVNSNLEMFYQDYSFLQSHTPRDASVALLLQNGLGKYLYSSSINYHHLQINSRKPITYSDSIILPKLSTSSVQLISVGSDSSRVNKTQAVADIPDAQELLDVCIDETNEENCSQCFKCMKTQLALDVGGKLDQFNKVFNPEVYKKKRIEFITSIHRSQSIHLHEILDLAKEKEYHVPYRTRFYSVFRAYGIRKRIMALVKVFG